MVGIQMKIDVVKELDLIAGIYNYELER